MIFTEEFRKKLKLGKNFCLPTGIRFETGVVYLVGLESSVRLQVDHDLFGPVEIPGEMHFEGDSVSSIIDMITKGADFDFTPGQVVATHGNVRTVFRAVSLPEERVPTYLASQEPADQVWSATVDQDLSKFIEGVEFSFAAIRASKASMFSNRIFFTKLKDKVMIFGTDNTVMNMSYCSLGKHEDIGTLELIFPAKALNKAMKLVATEQEGIRLLCYRDCAIIQGIQNGIEIHFPVLMGTVPNCREILEKVRGCDSTVRVEDVANLVPPKEMLKVGNIAELSVSKSTGINISILHTGASSLFNTELHVNEEIEDVTFKVKKDEFFRCLSTLSGSIIVKGLTLRWNSYSPLFLALQTEGKLSVHALELGEWQ